MLKLPGNHVGWLLVTFVAELTVAAKYTMKHEMVCLAVKFQPSKTV
jgi:hypothetical protein